MERLLLSNLEVHDYWENFRSSQAEAPHIRCSLTSPTSEAVTGPSRPAATTTLGRATTESTSGTAEPTPGGEACAEPSPRTGKTVLNCPRGQIGYMGMAGSNRDLRWTRFVVAGCNKSQGLYNTIFFPGDVI